MKEKLVELTLIRDKVLDEETHISGGNKELEHTIIKLGDKEMSGVAPNGGLKEEANRVR